MSVIVKGMKMPKNCLHCDFDDSYGICACRNEAPYVCEYSAKQRPSWCPLEEVPSAQPETHEERTETHACDCISRQAAIDVCNKAIDLWQGQLGEGIVIAVRKKIEELPSAQPQLPEWAQKVEEYRKSAPSFVRNQLVWALFQTWKEYDGRLVHQR